MDIGSINRQTRVTGGTRVVGKTLEGPGGTEIGGQFIKYLIVGGQRVIVPDYVGGIVSKFNSRDPGIPRVVSETLEVPGGTGIAGPF